MHVPRKLVALTGVTLLLTGTVAGALGSSHREAPYTSVNPQLDATDLYAWRTEDDTVAFVYNVYPEQEPTGGPNFFRFGDNVVYDINIDNDGNARRDITFRFTFKTIFNDPDTFLYNDGAITSPTDADLTFRQVYNVTRLSWDTRTGNKLVASRTLGTGIPVPPVYVGNASNGSPSAYETMARQAIRQLPGDFDVFAGQRDDPFYLDLRVFDLLYGGDLSEVGEDTLKGKNVFSIVLEAPIEDLTDGNEPVIGIWANTLRRSTQVLNNSGRQSYIGPWVRTSRLGMPLVNEVVVPIGLKDYFNASRPEDDAQFLPAVLAPELAKRLNQVYALGVTEEGRDDLVSVFLTGVEGLNMPDGVQPAEMLRLNTDIEPCTADRADDDAGRCQRLGVLAGDTAGFPNGRRLTDDVIDIALQVVAGELIGNPNDLGDAVSKNDKDFTSSFPYVASANSGSDHVHHGRGMGPN